MAVVTTAEARIVGTFKDGFTATSGRAFDKLKKDASAALKKVAVIGTAAFAAISVQSIRAANEQDRAIKKLEASLRSTRQFNSQYLQDLQRMASQAQNLSTVGDEAILGVQQRLIAFGATRKNIKQVTQAVIDLSAGLATDLNASALLVGKALAGEFGTLSRYGILVEENATQSEKLEQALKQIEDRFGGQAQAELQVFSGQVQQLSNLWGDLQENVGFFVTRSQTGIEIVKFWKKEIQELIGVMEIMERLSNRSTLEKQFAEAGERITAIRNQIAELRRQSQADLLFGDAQLAVQQKLIERQKELIEAIGQKQRLEKLVLQEKKIERDQAKKTAEEEKARNRVVKAVLPDLALINTTTAEIAKNIASFKGFGDLDISGSAGLGFFGQISEGMLKLNEAQRKIQESRADEKLTKENEVLERRLALLQQLQNPGENFKKAQADLFALVPDAFGDIDLSSTLNPEQFEAFIERAEQAGVSLQALQAIAQKNAELSQSAGLNLDNQEVDVGLINQLNARRDALTAHLATEEELERISHERRLEDLRLLNENRIILDDERHILELELEQSHQDKLTQIRQNAANRLATIQAREKSQVIGAAQQLVGALGAVNDSIFNQSKGLAIGLATVNAFLAASQVLADPSNPTFLGKLATYTKILAIGLGLAASISNINKGGGGTVTGAGGQQAQPVSDVTPQAAGPTFILPNFDDDDLVRGSAIKNLFKEVNSRIERGGRIIPPR